jgi:uncharacterized damage-inducible protein DinB
MTNKEFFIQTWQGEMPRTLGAVNGLPDDMTKLDYHCNEKARSAEALISHFLGHAEALDNGIGSFVANEKGAVTKFATRGDAASYFEKHATSIVEKLKDVDDETWENQMVDFQVDGRTVFAAPMFNVFWGVMFDIIHHRGQLSTYYRNMGVRNPSIYGPTAEDIEAMLASQAAQN